MDGLQDGSSLEYIFYVPKLTNFIDAQKLTKGAKGTDTGKAQKGTGEKPTVGIDTIAAKTALSKLNITIKN